MKKTLEFIFDFGSPNAYLAYKTLPSILERNNTELKITPALLGGIFKATGNQGPMMAFNGIKGKLEYEQLEITRFIKKHKLFSFKFNSHFPVNSLMLVRGAIVADQDGRLDEYVQVGLKSMWEEDLKMDDPQVFAETFSSAGFDGEQLLERMQEQGVKDQLAQNTQDAVDRGVFGISTFFVGEEMFFGKDRLDQVAEELGVE